MPTVRNIGNKPRSICNWREPNYLIVLLATCLFIVFRQFLSDFQYFYRRIFFRFSFVSVLMEYKSAIPKFNIYCVWIPWRFCYFRPYPCWREYPKPEPLYIHPLQTHPRAFILSSFSSFIKNFIYLVKLINFHFKQLLKWK